jgi:hypothetical protein
MSALPAMQMFRDVPVVPNLRAWGKLPVGGPLWPDFAAQGLARHHRFGQPADEPPRRPETARRLDRPAVWGGYLDPQFGHLLAEHLTRLPQSRRDRPGDLYLFTVQPYDQGKPLPPHVWDILAWHGLGPDQVQVVETPCLAAELWVAAQGETLGMIPPLPGYLDRLEEITRDNGLVPEPHDLVYVSREGLVRAGRGGHAGEGYLTTLLAAQGVTVIDPARLPIRRQLEIYAGARVLVFAEGSALHGRCLLGRVAQDIHVLRRRSMRNIALAQLEPRCTHLRYHQVLAGKLGTASDTRPTRPDLEAALYDPEVLVTTFARFGVDLVQGWDDAAYCEAVRQDVIGWLATHDKPSAEQLAENLEVLADLDLDFDLPPGFTLPPEAATTDWKG